MNTLQQILDEHIRPKLKDHGGDIRIVSFENGVLKVKLEGQCLGCASNDFTIEFIDRELKTRVPEIKEIIFDDSVSEELLAMAREILKKGRRDS